MSPVIQARTREQLRVAVGYNLNVLKLITAAANGSTTTFLTDDLIGGADDHNGKWWLGTDSPNDGTLARVVDSTISSNQTTLTLYPAVSSTLNNDTAELWEQKFDPTRIEDFINQAIIAATGHAYDPVEDISLHADREITRFDIPANISIINRLQYRSAVANVSVHLMDRLFDETTDADFTQASDDQDKKEGGASLRLTIAGTVSAGDFVTDSIDSLDLSKYTHIEGWVKATTTLAANDFVLRLDSGVVQGDATDLEILNVPATTAADTWTFFRIALANPESDTAIVSIGLEYNANQAANTVWFEDVRAVIADSSVWTNLPTHLWEIDVNARDLILKQAGRDTAGYSLLKIVGGDKPALLTADGSTTEIDDTYIIRFATALALQAAGNPTAVTWLALAEQAKRNFPVIENGRIVE